MTATAERITESEGQEGLIFLPGFQEGIAIGNVERDLSRIEFAIIAGRGIFERIKGDVRATEVMHTIFLAERARLLGGSALASVSEM
jgi:hypothetical protein